MLKTRAEFCWWPGAFLAVPTLKYFLTAAPTSTQLLDSGGEGTEVIASVSKAQFCSHHRRLTYWVKSSRTGEKYLQIKKSGFIIWLLQDIHQWWPKKWKQRHTNYATKTWTFFNGDTLLITIYFEVMRCQQQNRLSQQVRLDTYLIDRSHSCWLWAAALSYATRQRFLFYLPNKTAR